MAVWSLPSRERGLKHLRCGNPHKVQLSLPSRERGLKRTGDNERVFRRWSLPSRERGLKPEDMEQSLKIVLVAPFAGAWIETLNIIPPGTLVAFVAPFAGAWIETDVRWKGKYYRYRRSLRGSVD